MATTTEYSQRENALSDLQARNEQVRVLLQQIRAQLANQKDKDGNAIPGEVGAKVDSTNFPAGVLAALADIDEDAANNPSDPGAQDQKVRADKLREENHRQFNKVATLGALVDSALSKDLSGGITPDVIASVADTVATAIADVPVKVLPKK